MSNKQEYPKTKAYREMVVKLLAQGWRVERTTDGFKCYPSDPIYSLVTFHDSESDRRAVANTRSRLRQRGAKL